MYAFWQFEVSGAPIRSRSIEPAEPSVYPGRLVIVDVAIRSRSIEPAEPHAAQLIGHDLQMLQSAAGLSNRLNQKFAACVVELLLLQSAAGLSNRLNPEPGLEVTRRYRTGCNPQPVYRTG